MEKTPDYWKFIEDCDDAIDELLVLQEEKGIEIGDEITKVAELKWKAKKSGMSVMLKLQLTRIRMYIREFEEGSYS